MSTSLWLLYVSIRSSLILLSFNECWPFFLTHPSIHRMYSKNIPLWNWLNQGFKRVFGVCFAKNNLQSKGERVWQWGSTVFSIRSQVGYVASSCITVVLGNGTASLWFAQDQLNGVRYWIYSISALPTIFPSSPLHLMEVTWCLTRIPSVATNASVLRLHLGILYAHEYLATQVVSILWTFFSSQLLPCFDLHNWNSWKLEGSALLA